MSQPRRVLTLIGRVLGGITGGYLGYVALRGSRLLVQPEVRPFVPDAEGGPSTPADLGLDYEDVRFKTDDGVTLGGWLVPAARETRAAVILMHGFSGHRLPELAFFVPWLQRRYHVLQFDFRGHGTSDASMITLGTRERADVAAAVRFAESRGLGPLALMGISMGAAIAILAAPDLPVAAVVADAAYAELRHPIASRLRASGYPLAELGSWAIVAAGSIRARRRLLSPIERVGADRPARAAADRPTRGQPHPPHPVAASVRGRTRAQGALPRARGGARRRLHGGRSGVRAAGPRASWSGISRRPEARPQHL